MTEYKANLVFDKKNKCYFCKGNWSILNLENVDEQFNKTPLPVSETITIDGKDITQFDSAGALSLIHCLDKLKKQNNHIKMAHFNEQQYNLIELITSKQDVLSSAPPARKKPKILYYLGTETIEKIKQFFGLVELLGDFSDKIFLAFGQWRRFQFPSIVANINSTGLKALPILALLSFLIGVVLAYQMGLQFETY